MKNAYCRARRALGLLTATLLLSACVTLPDLPPIESGAVKRVGVYVGFIDFPTHTHHGATIFNNFHRAYELDWDMRNVFTELIEQELTAAGFDVVSLEDAGYDPTDFPVARTAEGGGFEIANPATRDRLQAASIDAVITVNQLDRLLMRTACNQYVCTDVFAEGYGLYTRTFLGIGGAEAAFGFDLSAETLAPAAVLTRSAAMEAYSGFDATTVKLEAKPEDVKNIDAETWERTKEALVGTMRERVALIASLLNGG